MLGESDALYILAVLAKSELIRTSPFNIQRLQRGRHAEDVHKIYQARRIRLSDE